MGRPSATNGHPMVLPQSARPTSAGIEMAWELQWVGISTWSLHTAVVRYRQADPTRI